MGRGRQRRFGWLVSAICLSLVSLGGNGPALALTALELRPSDPLPKELTARLEVLAGEIGWGSLYRTEQMARADTAYGGGPVIAVTATPVLPVLAHLESRAWAAERFLDEDAADRRLAELQLDPSTSLAFDLLVIAETPEALDPAALAVTYRESPGAELSGSIEAHEISLEPTLGGDLHAARARIVVDLPEGHAWEPVQSMTVELQAGGQSFELLWTFP